MTDVHVANRLKALHEAGQAVWLDFVDRNFLAQGGLKALIAADGLTGVTSNPAIFEKAMGHGDAYDEGLKRALTERDDGVMALYESQAIADIRAAAADLRPVYDRLDGRDGYVSLEVSPHLANDTDGTILEARRLWQAVDAPNLMVKVPGTAAGVPAIRQLIEDGVNINVTLLFAIDGYQAVAEAYAAGLEARVARGEPIDRIASVASFFISRIDSVIDKAIDAQGGEAAALRGKVAIANAKLAYDWYRGFVASDRWRRLAERGAMPQRLLWASTGTKDKAYPDTLYVDELIGPDTVNTMPVATMDAFRERGTVAQTLTQDLGDARHVVAEAARLGLDLDGVTRRLAEEGVGQFVDAFDVLLGGVADKRVLLLGTRLNALTADLPEALNEAVERRLRVATAERWPLRFAAMTDPAPDLWASDMRAVTGLDDPACFEAARPMLLSCGADVPAAANPGVRLGAILAEAAAASHETPTILASPGLMPLGAWLERLLAEAIGRPLGATERDRGDSLFVRLQLDGDPEDEQPLLDAAAAGHAVVRIGIPTRAQIGQECIRWKIAAAVAEAGITER